MKSGTEKNAGILGLLTAGLILSFLSAGRPGFSMLGYRSLEDYISRSKIILVGRAIEKSTEPVKTVKVDETSVIKSGIDETKYYSLKIEVSKLLKGEIIGNYVSLLYPVSKFHSPGKGEVIGGISEAFYIYTELEEWGEKRIWLLAESKAEAGYYQKENIYSLSSYSLIETTLGILQLSETEQVAELIKMLASDKRPFVWTALDMLPRRKANAAVEPLISMLTLGDNEILEKVYAALLSINDDAGNLKLIQVLENKVKNKMASLQVGSGVSAIIACIQDRRVVPVLMEALANPDFKEASISKLGDLRAVEAVERLLPFLDDADIYVRYVTCSALGKIGDPRALPRLEKALNRASERERENIKKAIQEIKKRG